MVNNDQKRKARYDFGIGSGFIAFIAYRWASTLVQEGGQKPSEHVGLVIGLWIGFVLMLFLSDYVLWRLRFTKVIRSGLWASAALGPYVALVAWEAFGHPVWSHVIGLVSTILVFIVFYLLENRLKNPL